MTKLIITSVVIVLVLVGGFVWARARLSVAPARMSSTADQSYRTSLGTPASATSSFAQRRDLGEISLSVGDRADILAVDNAARYTGFDPTSATVTEQIPRSHYETDSPGSDEAKNAPAPTTHSIHIDRPHSGVYLITLTGLKNGQYTLIIRTFAEDGSAQPAIQYNGQTAPGLMGKFQLNYASAPDAISSLTTLSP